MTDQSKRILVVDDDVRLRELLQRYLTEQGFTVDLPQNPRQRHDAAHFNAHRTW